MVSLVEDTAVYPRTSGKVWQCSKQRRAIVRSVSPIYRQWVKLSVLHELVMDVKHRLWIQTGLGSEVPTLLLLVVWPQLGTSPPFPSAQWSLPYPVKMLTGYLFVGPQLHPRQLHILSCLFLMMGI